MVFCRCPNCRQLFHLSPSIDVGDWYAQFAPDLKPGEEPAIECFWCWKTLSLGDTVCPIAEFKADESEEALVKGVIVAIDESEPKRFVVEFENQIRESFERSELRYCNEKRDQ